MIKYMPKSVTEFVMEIVMENDGDSDGDMIIQQGWSCLWYGGM